MFFAAVQMLGEDLSSLVLGYAYPVCLVLKSHWTGIRLAAALRLQWMIRYNPKKWVKLDYPGSIQAAYIAFQKAINDMIITSEYPRIGYK